jgi:hypothetical protein
MSGLTLIGLLLVFILLALIRISRGLLDLGNDVARIREYAEARERARARDSATWDDDA